MPRRDRAAFLVAALLLLPSCSSNGDDAAPAAATDSAARALSETTDGATTPDATPPGADGEVLADAATPEAADGTPEADHDATATDEATTDEVTATDGRWATITMGTQGGLCPEGVCSRHVIVDEAEQTWSASTSAGESSEGEVDAAAVDALARLIESRWEALTATPFEGDCPTAHDGQERVLDVAFAPVDGTGEPGERVSRSTSSCTHAWPADVIAEIDAAWDDAGLPR